MNEEWAETEECRTGIARRRQPPAGLLVSVRNADEAVAAAPWVDIVDVKDPARGPLGAATPEVWASILAVVDDKPVTLALGEADDWLDAGTAAMAAPQIPAQVAAVKLGPGLSGDRERVERARRLFDDAAGRRLPWVAVAYADRSFDVERWMADAAEQRCVAALVDTFDKRGPSITNLWTETKLRRVRNHANANGLPFVLAGKVSKASLATLSAMADYVGLRSAACDDENRSNGITSVGVEACLHELRRHTVAVGSPSLASSPATID